jgi:NAD(P)-dependent dehydrogenase (short-subunit alcohol dehydrogenase family)
MTTLNGKNAVIYGAGGSIGAAVAKTFAREGAHVELVGRTEATLAKVAAEIEAAGGSCAVAVLDATDQTAVEQHLADLVARRGSVDVSLNLIVRGDVQGLPLVNMSADDLLRAVDTGLRSAFLTSRAAVQHMTTRGSGVILHLNSASGAGAAPGMGSTGPADAAAETYYRYLAAENGPAGVRVCGIWTAGVAETLTREKIGAVSAEGPDPEQALAMIAGMAALRRTPRLADVAETAAFLASDRAGGITGTTVNVTCGLVLR